MLFKFKKTDLKRGEHALTAMIAERKIFKNDLVSAIVSKMIQAQPTLSEL